MVTMVSLRCTTDPKCGASLVPILTSGSLDGCGQSARRWPRSLARHCRAARRRARLLTHVMTEDVQRRK